MKEGFFGNKTLWILTSSWTFVYFFVVLINFIFENKMASVLGPFSALYIGILSIYVGSKEFDRWLDTRKGKRRGELFVFAFTLIVFLIICASLYFDRDYISSEVVAAYIAVLSLFAITQKSKEFYNKKHRK